VNQPVASQGTATSGRASGGISPVALPAQQWYTVQQAARLLFREPKTVLNLLSRHQLPRRKIRGPGRSHRRIVIISQDTLERLQRLTW